MDRSLLIHFLQEFPFQPAVAFWRADEMTETLKIPFPEGRGFDLGCGDGKICKLLLDHIGPREMAGLDIDERETALARASGIYTRVHTGSADVIPEPDASFDFVFSNCVLEHIPQLEPVIKETARILKPGGQFIFTVPSDQYHACMRGPLVPWVSRQKYLKELDDRQIHYHYLTTEQWSALLSSYAMELTLALPYLRLKAARRWETMSRFTGGIVYNLFQKRKPAQDKHLIDYQWQFGVRSKRLPIPKWMVAGGASLCTLGIPESSQTSETPYGARIVVACKR